MQTDQTDTNGSRTALVYLESPFGGELTPCDAYAPRERRIVINGQDYDHVAETDDGAWIYRKVQ